ncbi:DUF711 family protein [Maridesulfovibrio bastinii]|uniref:DUF711 family protein n=1 Tax=Maridesulfovibrio bastinii TaxID=47157 RepID=UPI00042A1AF6|nr:DUF711 family protein [Maridesulfovibrio bastinii]
MSYKDKDLCRIRTITAFFTLDKNKEAWKKELLKASHFCSHLSETFNDNGYVVQSLRLVTNPFGEYLNTESLETARDDLNYITELLNSADMPEIRLRFAIGEARTREEIEMLPELINEFGDLCNVCVNVDLDEFGILDNKLIEDSARAVTEISRITPRGEGNFNFTVNFNCKSFIPYFPASYHREASGYNFVIGLETPDLLVDVLKTYNSGLKSENHNARFKGYFEVMSQALQFHISTISSLVSEADIDSDFNFSGFDSSAAPSKNCSSMAEVYQQIGVEYFGASGTVEASALLTRVFKSIKDVDIVGFSGLMLALTEDSGLAAGSIEGNFDIRSLLTYSSVCGIGLDTVPIPGDTPIDKICALMRDTGTMAYRLNKPLTVRLFPVPGLKAGDITAFESDDLCNCAVLAVP